jgi:hypothetical protein
MKRSKPPSNATPELSKPKRKLSAAGRAANRRRLEKAMGG